MGDVRLGAASDLALLALPNDMGLDARDLTGVASGLNKDRDTPA